MPRLPMAVDFAAQGQLLWIKTWPGSKHGSSNSESIPNLSNTLAIILLS
ncbi:hypothetical protein [Desulfosporosinus nitroreducens]|uniref:Uncharacterized protein n=1 Tax=Desulfosporosinus nitroreducens TaxID=2018668 RepID=A0ABT8QNV8_9FIRM|nr:hypothetical protein [Desulfosporosinus nitroreducens]MDO0822284.1 hypothetical protein [Desulfosporosinus nitroreducens]